MQEIVESFLQETLHLILHFNEYKSMEHLSREHCCQLLIELILSWLCIPNVSIFRSCE